MRHLFLAFFALLCYSAAMNYEPEQQGYSRSDLAAMSKLIDRETRTKPVSRHRAMTGLEKRIALQSLGWEVAGK